jgi:hypothetical protein
MSATTKQHFYEYLILLPINNAILLLFNSIAGVYKFRDWFMFPLLPVSCWDRRRRSHCFAPHIVTALPEKDTRARSPVTATIYRSSAVARESHASTYTALTYLWTPSCRVFPSSSPQHQVLVSDMHEKPFRAAFLFWSIKQ